MASATLRRRLRHGDVHGGNYERLHLLCEDLFDGTRAKWEYPFAVAGINISFMLAQMLDLQSGKPSTIAGVRFMEFVEEDEMAFDNLYCIAFQMMDAQWLVKRASYMEFNDVLKSTRAQLELDLALKDVSSIRDLPAYNPLHKEFHIFSYTFFHCLYNNLMVATNVSSPEPLCG